MNEIEVDARISNISNRHENLERILVISLPNASLHIPLNFRLPFLAMARKPQFFLVTPQYRRSCGYTGLGEEKVKIYNLEA